MYNETNVLWAEGVWENRTSVHNRGGCYVNGEFLFGK